MRDASRQFVARFDSRVLPEAPEVSAFVNGVASADVGVNLEMFF
ncbi:AraC family transcriptional regulator [Pandoraea horticolens]|uniref:AraC family transcriptional regulator n=1 Tax=Pandoraea horticolens TaxID=2508298 RepID=A0A5E4TVW5_9BURK|nr:hypothetical protein [Pandoraea horticolens]VVD91937.1 AraC family transcriptional regulator [Pandoraea horticolens]